MTQIFITLIVGLCLTWLAYASAQKMEVGAVLSLFFAYVIVPGAFLYSKNSLLFAVDPIFNVGSINFYPNDAVIILLLLAFIFRLLLRKIKNLFPFQRNLIIVFVGLVGISTLLGILQYGQGSPNEARRYLIVIAPLLYFVSFTYTRKELVNLAKIVIAGGILISIIGLIRLLFWQGQLLNTSTYLAYQGVRTTIGISTDAIIIVIAWLILMVAKLHGFLKKSVITNFLLLFFLLMLVILQERTLWVIIGIYLVYFLLQHNLKFLWYAPVAILIIVLLGGILYIYDLFHVRQLLLAITIAFTTIIAPHGTLAGRFSGWTDLLTNLPLLNYFIGLPFGAGYTHLQFGILVEFNPHNFYVIHILRIGIVGLLAYVLSHIFILTKAYKVKRVSRDRFSATVAEIIALGIFANLLVSITYSLGPLGGLIWGLGVAVIYSPIKSTRDSRIKDALPSSNNHPIPTVSTMSKSF